MVDLLTLKDVAKKLKVSDLVIGLTIVAFGTSAPELIINIISNIRGVSDMAIGNIIGANIANILMIGGIAAMIYPIKITKGTAWKEIPLSLIAGLLLLILANDYWVNKNGILMIVSIDGLILIGFFLAFLYYTFGLSKIKSNDDIEYKTYSWIVSFFYIILGITGLTMGGQWIVNGATKIASMFGLSEALIGLTVLSIGTTLPELAASSVAAFKKNADLAIGNIIGSSIFNIFMILGLSSTIKPLIFNTLLNTDIIIYIGTILLLYWFILTGKEARRIERWEGAALFCFYLMYITFLIWRG